MAHDDFYSHIHTRDITSQASKQNMMLFNNRCIQKHLNRLPIKIVEKVSVGYLRKGNNYFTYDLCMLRFFACLLIVAKALAFTTLKLTLYNIS